MSSTIELAKPLSVGTADTPLDVRTRIASLADLEMIELPYAGMLFFVQDIGQDLPGQLFEE